MAKMKVTKLAIDGGEKVLKEPFPPRGLFGRAEKAAVTALFDKAIKTGNAFGYEGEEEQAYCREFAEFLGGGYADAVNSGTTAVYVALRALELEPCTEVICPPVTDAGGVMPVPLCGCVPIPADAAPGSYNVGPDQIEARITKNTGAIIVAHIAGIPADMEPIMEIARAKGIPVIEDCAQAHGAKHRGKYVGTLGDLGAFSTMFGKHYATGGQGGLVFTKGEEMYWRVRRHSDRGKPFGLKDAPGNVVCSLNFNLNDLSACIGRVQLKRLPKIIASRRRVALQIAEGCRRNLKAVRMVGDPSHGESSYWFPFFHVDLDKIKVDKETFAKALAAEGVLLELSYYRQYQWTEKPWYVNRAVFGKSGLPWTSSLYKGNPDKRYPLPNIQATDAEHFRLYFHESLTRKWVTDLLTALRKVEAAYLK